MVARLHVGDLGADLLDDARALVPEHRRRGPRDGAVDDADVAVADAGGGDAHEDLARPGRSHFERARDLGLLPREDDSPHARRPFAVLGATVTPGKSPVSSPSTTIGDPLTMVACTPTGRAE